MKGVKAMSPRNSKQLSGALHGLFHRKRTFFRICRKKSQPLSVYSFGGSSPLRQLRQRREKKKIRCPFCEDLILSSKSTYKNHMQYFHFPRPSVKRMCNICQLDMKTLYHLRKHELRHLADVYAGSKAGYKCHKCFKILSSKYDLDKHFQRYHTPLKYTCDLCDEILDSKYEMEQHKEVCFRSESDYVCDICKKVLKSRSAWKNHKDSFHSEMALQCGLCFQNFDSKYGYEEHRKICCRGVDTKYLCSVCNKNLCSASNLKRHKRIHAETSD